MKLFLISNMYPTQENPGYGVFVKNVCDGMEKYGIHTVYKAVIRGKSHGFAKVFNYLRFYKDIIINYFKKYDSIYVHVPTHSVPVLKLLGYLKKKPVVFNFHAEDLLYRENYGYISRLGHMSDKFCSQTKFIVVPSSYFRDIVVTRGLTSAEKVVVSASGGIDDSLFYYKGPKEQHDYFHLGFVSRLEKDKGVLEFIDACKTLGKEHQLKATIIGYGPLNDEVAERTIDDPRFTVIYGVTQDKLPDFYSDFDLFCFPSSRAAESLGLVGIEAMACGTPVLGGDIGGIKSYIRHGENGYLLSLSHLTEDMVSYTKAFIDMNGEERQAMVDKAVSTARLYSRDLVCKQLAGEFKKRINNQLKHTTNG